MTAPSTDSAIASAIATIIRGITPAIVPQTTLAAPAAAGATTVTVAAGTGSTFTDGQMLAFADTLGEAALPISAVSGDVLTLDFTGLAYSSLKFTHTSGTTVSTNLLTFYPTLVARMLALGQPLICVYGLHEADRWFDATRQVYPSYTFLIQYYRAIYRPSDARMQTTMWAQQQQAAARADVETIADSLRNNPRLGNTVQALGARGDKRAPILTKEWARLVKDEDTEVFGAGMKLTCWGMPELFAVPAGT